MKAAATVAAERISELLLRFNLSTAALEMSKRLAGHEEALQLVSEVLELEAEARQQRRVARLRRAAQLPADTRPDPPLGSRRPVRRSAVSTRTGSA